MRRVAPLFPRPFLFPLCLFLLGLGCVSTRRPLPGGEWTKGNLKSEVRVQVFDPSGRPETPKVRVGPGGGRIGALAASPWAEKIRAARAPAAGQPPEGRGSPGAAPAGTRQGEGEEPQDQGPGREQLFARFGQRIWILPDGRVTKPYYVNQETGIVLNKLLELSGIRNDAEKGAPGQHFLFKKDPKRSPSLLDTLLGGYEIEIHLLPKFDAILTQRMTSKGFTGQIQGAKPADYNDLVLVTAKPDGLEAFEQTMHLFYASVPQVLIEVQVLEISHGDTLDIGVGSIDSKTPTIRTRGKGSFIRSLTSKFPNSSLSTTGSAVGPSSEGVLIFGGIQDNLELNAQLELLQTRAKADIISNPKIAVRNGGMAVIETNTEIPFPQAQIIGNNTKTSISFKRVGVTLAIRPVVTPGDMVLLQIQASVSAITGFANTDPIPTPEISNRTATTHVFVPNGKSTSIGGLMTKNKFENVSQIPILGDIPILGYLFRSTFIQNSYSEVVFFIKPQVIYGFEGIDTEEDFGGGGF